MLEQVRNVWKRLSSGQKLLVGGLTGALFLCLVVAFVVGSGTDYRFLAELEPTDARKIVARLDEAAIANRVSADGRVIEIDASALEEARRLLLKEGLVAGGSSGGYESLKDIGIGDSKRVVDERLRIAKEGEVAQTVKSSLGGIVQSAKVLITPAKETFYREGSEPAKAAVALQLRPGAVLEPDQVQGVRALVANSWQGLAPRDVTLTANGRLVAGPEEGEGPGAAIRLLAHAREQALQAKVESALAEAFGAENIRVRVTLELDRTSEVRTSTELHGDRKVPSKEEFKETENTRERPGGVTGVQGTLQERSRGTGDGTTSSTVEQTTDYKVPGTVTQVRRDAGEVRRITVGVLVDESLKEQEAEIAEIAKAMVGFDESRNDVFSLRAVRFLRPPPPDPAPEPGLLQRPEVMRWAYWVGSLLVSGIVLLYFMRSAKRARRALRESLREDEPEQGRTDGGTAGEEGASGAPASAEVVPPADPKKEIIDVIDRNPEAVSKILRNWLYEPATH